MAGLIDTGINYRKQANAAFGEAAKGAMERENANRKLNAAEKAGAWNAAGQGLGMGYTAYESGLLGKAANGLGASKGVVDALTPGGDVAGAVNELTVAPSYSAGSLKGAVDTAGQLGLGQGANVIPSPEGAKSVADIAQALDPSVAANTVNAANTAGQAAEATSGSSTTGGLGTIGGAIEGATAGAAAGGAAGGIGGGIGGAIGGTVASPLAAAGTLANAVGLTGVGSSLTGAAGSIAAGAANAGAGAMSWLAALLL